MALIKVLNASRPIPAGGASSVLRLRAVPVPGQAWRMFSQNFGFVCRGRFVTLGAGMTSISVRISASEVGAPEGLEANIITINSTSITAGTSYPLPIIDLLQAGTSTEPSTVSLILGFGFPLSKLEVISARAGLHWQPGDNLLDPKHGDTVLAW